jgi:hypothetical protein
MLAMRNRVSDPIGVPLEVGGAGPPSDAFVVDGDQGERTGRGVSITFGVENPFDVGDVRELRCDGDFRWRRRARRRFDR